MSCGTYETTLFSNNIAKSYLLLITLAGIYLSSGSTIEHSISRR